MDSKYILLVVVAFLLFVQINARPSSSLDVVAPSKTGIGNNVPEWIKLQTVEIHSDDAASNPLGNIGSTVQKVFSGLAKVPGQVVERVQGIFGNLGIIKTTPAPLIKV